ncbi:MAG TPA: hemolysin family protein [Hyphomicrobium sp.]|nr:hemolysin family protein [Hyphomicrobium sp.]
MTNSDYTAEKDDPGSAGEAAAAAGASTQSLISALLGRFGLRSPSLREMVEAGLKEQPEGDAAFSTEEREMLRRLLRFGGLRVDDIMVPRADIIALAENEPLSELLRMFSEAGVSRIPLFNETLDDPRGMIHIKDLFRWLTREAAGEIFNAPISVVGNAPVKAETASDDKPPPLDISRIDLSRPITVAKIRRPVLYVPSSMPATNLLIRMQTTRIHMALVVDEYGGTDGLVTIEDLVEQIVGDIEDEHDVAEAAYISIDPKLGLVASARTPVKELEEHFGMKLLRPDEAEDIDTLGGLMFALLGRVPVRGELVRHPSGLELEVLDADARRLKKVRIHQPLGTAPAPSPAVTSTEPEKA